MSFYFPNVDPVYLYQRRGTDSDPYIGLKDTNHVRKDTITMKEIPSYIDRVKAFSGGKELIEVEDDSPASSEFRIDYSTGLAHFNKKMDGKKVTLEYLGTGYIFFPSNRILLPDDKESIPETLQEMTDNADDAYQVIKEVSNLIFMGEFDSDMNYRKWNFVNFDNATYVAKEDIQGKSPIETDDWELVSSGVGFTGVYDEDSTYNIGSIVADKDRKNLYISLENSNDKDLDNEECWELMITLDDTVKSITGLIEIKMSELNNFQDELQDSDDQRNESEKQRDNKVDSHIKDISDKMSDFEDAESKRNSNEEDRKHEERERSSNEKERQDDEDNRKNKERKRKNQHNANMDDFKDLKKENRGLTEQVEQGLSNISEAEVNVDEKLNDVGLSLDNIDVAMTNMDEFYHQGEYNENTAYKKYNIVTHKGKSYIAVKDAPIEEDSDEENEPVENEDYWRVLAKDGEDGTKITVNGVEPGEDNDIDLEEIGFTTEQDISDLKDTIEEDRDGIIGDLGLLKTTKKETLVDSINELKKKIDDLIDIVSE